MGVGAGGLPCLGHALSPSLLRAWLLDCEVQTSLGAPLPGTQGSLSIRLQRPGCHGAGPREPRFILVFTGAAGRGRRSVTPVCGLCPQDLTPSCLCPPLEDRLTFKSLVLLN